MRKIIVVISMLIVTTVYTQTLEDYIKIAKENNSAIKIKNAEFNLIKERKNEVSSFQNTAISLGIFALTPETRVGSQLFKIGATQKLPWFGEFSAKKNLIEKLSEIKKNDIDLSDKEITFRVQEAYYRMYQQQAMTVILKRNKQILKTYENMALAALSNNKATMSDVLRIRVQKNELHSRIFQNINTIETLYRNFNTLLQRAKNSPLFIADSLQVLDILIQKSSIKLHPSLMKFKNMEAVYDAQKELITIDKKPKITIGVDYILVNNRTDIAVLQNGKDILMPKISLSIPLFTKKHNSQYKQLNFQKEILKNEIIQQENTLEMAFETAILDLENAIISVVAAQKNKTEIQRAINVDLKAYETGILNYDKILKLQIQKIRFELLEIEATKNAFIAKAKTIYLSKK